MSRSISSICSSINFMCDVPQFYFGILQDLLHSIFFRRTRSIEPFAPAGQIPQFSNRAGRYETRMDHGVAEQMCQPPIVLVVRLVALAVLYLTWIGQVHLDRVFQHMNTGFQYDPVLSITTCVTASRQSQSRSCCKSAMLTPNLRRSTRGSPLSGPTIRHTDHHFFPTSIPAQRSTAAQIISLSFLSGKTVDVYGNKFFHGSTAPFGDSSRQPGQFRLRAQLRTTT